MSATDDHLVCELKPLAVREVLAAGQLTDSSSVVTVPIGRAYGALCVSGQYDVGCVQRSRQFDYLAIV
jgi:hypothetical protein